MHHTLCPQKAKSQMFLTITLKVSNEFPSDVEYWVSNKYLGNLPWWLM